MATLHAGQRRRSARLAVVVALALAGIAACGRMPATRGPATLSPTARPPARPSLAVPSAAPVNVLPAVSLAPLPADLVGTWRTSHWLNSDGSQADWRIYRFTPEGLYEYTLAQCTPSCVVQGYEWGYAQAANGLLSLTPQTASSEGPRAWPYAVGRDPNVGDVQLHLALPDGQTDIFYFG
jgi:hypothetical protein